MSTDTQNQVSVIEKSLETFKKAPEILKANQERSRKALVIGNSILEQWANAWKIEDKDERIKALSAADERSNKFLANCTTAVTQEKEARAVVTQLMTEIARMYTACENEIDKTKPGTVPFNVQNNRDTYAEELAKETKRREREAQEVANRARAWIDHKLQISSAISQCLNSYLAHKKNLWNNAFNEITLENIEAKSLNLANLECAFPLGKLKEIVFYEVTGNYPFTQEEFKAIDDEAFKEFNFHAFYDTYLRELTELKQSLIDRLPSKKAELDKIAKASKKEKERLEAEAKEREENYKLLLAKEAEESQRKAQLELDLKSQAETTLVMFEKEAAVSEMTVKPETRTGYEIIVKHPVGYTQIFQFYFEKEGKTLALPELGKKTLDQMKAFCEKYAIKNNEFIDSKFLEYKDTYKSVSRKIVTS